MNSRNQKLLSLDELSKLSWEKTSARRATIHRYYDFSKSFSQQAVKKIKSIDRARVLFTHQNGECTQYHATIDWKKSVENLKKKIKQPETQEFLKKNMMTGSAKIVEWMRKSLYEKNLKKLTKKQVIKLFKEREKWHADLLTWQWFGFTGKYCIDASLREFLGRYVTDVEEAMQIIFALDYPVHVIEEDLQAKKIALLANQDNDQKKLKQRVLKHLKKYRATTIYDETYNEMTFGEVMVEIGSFRKDPNLEEKVKEIENRFRENKKKYNGFITAHKFSKKELKFIEVAHIFTHFSEIRNYYRGLSSLYSKGFFKQIAEMLGLELQELLCFGDEEILLALQGKMLLTKQEAEARSKKSVLIYDKNKFVFFTGEKADEIIDKFGLNSFEIKDLKGNVAYKGETIVGEAKIVNSVHDLHKLKEGDVLVSSMTRPEFLVAIKKSAAIVTDEGGITCHAAIVSRELKIPCVIGTKLATKLLKDGDLIEVDSEKGVVKLRKN